MSKRIVRSICALLALGVMASTASAQVPSKPKRIAHFHLSGALTEQPQEDPLGLTSGKMTSLKSLLERLDKARKDDSVRAIALTLGGLSMGAAQIEELRDALTKFNVVDKRVFVHAESLNTWRFALMSAATDVSVVPMADVWLTGFYGERLYLKNLLSKIGCEADIIHIGDFKSAGETLTRTGPSEAAAENLDWLIDGLYDGIVGMIAESRGMSSKQVRGLIDEGPYTAESALKAGLVDSVQYRDEFVETVRKMYGDDAIVDNRYAEKDGIDVDVSNPFAFFSVLTDLFGGKKKGTRGDSVGIVYVEGTIVPGYGERSPFGGSSGAYSGDISKALEEAAEDPSVKAVVLRVDSPGGSALASEIIWRATQQVRSRKPIVVSMGNVAGSGGYYVACGADAIVADEMTITGSIGVVGGKIITAGMWEKLGVNWVPIQRGRNANLLNTLEPFNDGQRTRIEDWMNEVYAIFKAHVQEGRGSKLSKALEEMAGGRVYTGKQALELGLVDKIGGLHDAIELAARKASIADYDVRVIPEPKNFIDMLFGELSGTGERPTDIAVRMKPLLTGPKPTLFDALLPLLGRMEPHRVAAVKQALQRIELLRGESVITMMPTDLVIR